MSVVLIHHWKISRNEAAPWLASRTVRSSRTPADHPCCNRKCCAQAASTTDIFPARRPGSSPPRLCKVRGTTLQFADFTRQPGQIVWLIEQPCLETDVILDRIGDAFTEPQRVRVILLRIIHRLQRLRPDALHIPQVEELVRGHIGEGLRVVRQHTRVDINRSAVGVFHPSSAGPRGK